MGKRGAARTRLEETQPVNSQRAFAPAPAAYARLRANHGGRLGFLSATLEPYFHAALMIKIAALVGLIVAGMVIYGVALLVLRAFTPAEVKSYFRR